MIPTSQQFAEAEVSHRRRTLIGTVRGGEVRMTRVCMGCGQVDGDPDGDQTHGLCPKCESVAMAEADQLTPNQESR